MFEFHMLSHTQHKRRLSCILLIAPLRDLRYKEGFLTFRMFAVLFPSVFSDAQRGKNTIKGSRAQKGSLGGR